MSKTINRVLWVLTGVLLIAAGIICLRNPGAALAGVTTVIGIVMLISGLVDIIVFAAAHNSMMGTGWILLDGILTVLLSLFVLCNEWFAALTLPFVFGMWLIVSGVSKFVNSFDLMHLGVSGWGWFTALGVLLTVAGFLSFLSPVSGAVAMATMIAVFLILQGIASILRGCFSSRLWL